MSAVNDSIPNGSSASKICRKDADTQTESTKVASKKMQTIPKAIASIKTQTENTVTASIETQTEPPKRRLNYPINWECMLLLTAIIIAPFIGFFLGQVFGSDRTSNECNQRCLAEKKAIKGEVDNCRQEKDQVTKDHERENESLDNKIRLLEHEKNWSKAETDRTQRQYDECKEERAQCSERKEKLDNDLFQCQEESKKNEQQCTREYTELKNKARQDSGELIRCKDHIKQLEKELGVCQDKLKGGSGGIASNSIGFGTIICIVILIMILYVFD